MRNKSCLANYSKVTEAKLFKLHRMVQGKQMYRVQDLGSCARGQGHIEGSKVIWGLNDYSKAAEANMVKFHRKVKGKEKICYA